MSVVLSTPIVPTPSMPVDGPDRQAGKPDKKARKLRSAWISFAGRIFAQLVGAVATVVFGIHAVAHFSTQAPSAIPAAAALTTEAPDMRASVVPRMSTRLRARLGDRRTLAVLPFEDFSAGQVEGDRLGDALTGALIANLARGGRFRVVSRTSSMQYKATRAPLPDIADALGATLVVEGSVVRSGERVRVTVQLVDAMTDVPVWADTYEHQGRDVLAIQDAVAGDITSALSAAVPDDSSPSPSDREAYLVRGADMP